jgi:uncharacterized Fe-S cluster-containing radical SAM superfamily protein
VSYDSADRHLAVEKMVTRKGIDGLERRYYRVRPARWYGGIVTADCDGCGLLCKFCWMSDAATLHAGEAGRFYSSKELANSLISLAKKCNIDLLRISGGEPTLGKQHLFQFLDVLQGKGYRFILETNGIPIAHDEEYALDLSKHSFVHVRVSLKGCNEEEYAKLTGAKPDGFKPQLKALRNLVDAKVSCHPSVMVSFSQTDAVQALIERLKQIGSSLVEELEIEELILYPSVIRKLQRNRLRYHTGYMPQEVPFKQI